MKPYYQDELVTIYNCDYREMKPVADVIVLDPPEKIDIGKFKAKTMFIFCGTKLYHWYAGQVPNSKTSPCFWYRRIYDIVYRAWINYADVILVVGRATPHLAESYMMPSMLERHHEWERPVELLVDLLKCTKGNILDQFLGSGSTAVAAKKLGRKCRGCDIEEKCCKIAADRCREIIYPSPYELLK